jgi:hypothetical protein
MPGMVRARGEEPVDSEVLRLLLDAIEPLGELVRRFGVDVTEALELPLPMRSSHQSLHLSATCGTSPLGGNGSWLSGVTLLEAADDLCRECLPEAVVLSPLAEWLFYASALRVAPEPDIGQLTALAATLASYVDATERLGFSALSARLSALGISVEEKRRQIATDPGFDEVLEHLARCEAARLVAVSELTRHPADQADAWLSGPAAVAAWAQLATQWPPVGDIEDVLVTGPVFQAAAERFPNATEAPLRAAVRDLEERSTALAVSGRERVFLVAAPAPAPGDDLAGLWEALRVRNAMAEEPSAVVVDGLAGPALGRRLGGVALELPAPLDARTRRLLPSTYLSLRTGALTDPAAALEAALGALAMRTRQSR